MKEDIKAEVPWDLYVVVIILAIAVIGLWGGLKHCASRKKAHLRTLRTKATRSSDKLTRNELKELQVLMTRDPASLDDDEKIRLVDLKELFDATMPANTSPLPTVPMEESASSSTSTPSVFNKQPKCVPRTEIKGFKRTHRPLSEFHLLLSM